jgi:hypothetical protein
MSDLSEAAYGRVRQAVIETGEPVRRLCAAEGVSWQAFYKHARRHGWQLRQTGRRQPPPRTVTAKLAAIVGSQLAALADAGPAGPRNALAAARLMAQCQATIARFAVLERKEEARPGRRPLMTDERRMQLAAKIRALCEEAEGERGNLDPEREFPPPGFPNGG